LNLTIQECSFYKDKMILKLCECDNPDDVKHLIGKNLFVKREELPLLNDDEYYWFDVLDMEVFTEKEGYLGKVENIIETGSNDVFVIKAEHEEILVPATRDVIKKIDYDQNTITIKMIEGLR